MALYSGSLPTQDGPDNTTNLFITGGGFAKFGKIAAKVAPRFVPQRRLRPYTWLS
jgi:hypothetical protein